MEHGGRPGTRDGNAVEAALVRPRNRWIYEETRELAELAASYCYGFARGHPYVDGNKRIGFLAMAVFLDLNGLGLMATDDDVVGVMRQVASGGMSESGLAGWIRDHVRPSV